MKPGLLVGDCLSRSWLKVDGFQRYSELDSCGCEGWECVFAVFGENGEYLGLVGSRQSALFPKRIFADLLVARQPAPLVADVPLDEALARFRAERCEHLPVVDGAGQFIGVISETSLFAALLEQEAKSRAVREALIGQLRSELDITSWRSWPSRPPRKAC